MKRVLIVLILVISAFAGQAQTAKLLADKIVAIVGDKIVLKSDIVNYIEDQKRQGNEMPENAECFLLERMMQDKALILQAEKDSLPVSDEEVEAELDQRVRYFIMQYGGKEAFEQIAGRTIYQVKEDFRKSIREGRLAKSMREKIVEYVKITPNEVKEYFNKIPKDSLPFYETELVIGQIVIHPKAGRELEKYAQDELADYRRQIESGQKTFETLARLYSEDPGSKQTGGRYEINKTQKDWDPDFKNAAFRLKEGQVSPVIKSKFGYHIIQMVSRLGDDAVIRHILRIPPITDEEINISIRKLDTVRSSIINGKFNFGEAVNKFSDDESAKFNGGTVSGKDGSTYITIDQLDKDMVIAIKDLKVGQYSKPQIYEERGVKKVRIVYLKTRTSPHRENIREDYNKIAQRAIEDKKQTALEKWFKDHLPQYYIYIDKSFDNCTSIGEWWKYASNKL